MWQGVVLAAAMGCVGADDRPITLQGPTELTVETLGPIAASQVPLPLWNGKAVPAQQQEHHLHPDGVVSWTAEGAQGLWRAEAPGTARITTRRRGGRRAVEWSVRVEPPVTLRLLDLPSRLQVGRQISARPVGEAPGQDGPVTLDALNQITWEAKPRSVLRVDANGRVTAIAPGTGYITVRADVTNGQHRTATATVELVVSPAP